MLEKIQETANYIQNKTAFTPEIGIILGTGLGGLVNEIEASMCFRMKIFQTFRFLQLKGIVVS